MTNVRALWRNLIAATVTALVLCYFSSLVGSLLLFTVALGYAAFFEYFYHRCISHSDFFPIAAEKHREHHRVWRGDGALSRDRTKLALNEDWYFFPIALLAHFFGGWLLLGWFPLEIIIAFALFYMQFEIFHWATHMEDNWIDEALYAVPIVKSFRREQINWHLVHHELPKEKFNFTPPYPGDYVFGTDRDWK